MEVRQAIRLIESGMPARKAEHLLELGLIGRLATVGKPGLFWAVLWGNVKKVQAALDAGADVNEKDSLGDTPLHLAASLLYDDIVKVLLAAGANTHIRNDDGLTPLGALDHIEKTVKLRAKHKRVAAEIKRALLNARRS